MIITGFELKQKSGHEFCGANDSDLYEFELTQTGSKAVRIPTEEENAQQVKQFRIEKLKEVITNKKLLDLDCVAEQNELKGLLGL